MQGDRYDVVVMGGGPAGASTAAVLAQAGRRVLVLERESFPRFHIGESLLPAAWELWDRLGVTKQLEAEGFAVKQGVNFQMFESPLDITLLTGEFPEYFQRPYTYHVERARFDKILLDNAREKGAEVREGWEVRDVLMDGTRAVGVMAGPVDGPITAYPCSVVVDATGRSCMLARKMGWRKPDPKLNKLSYFTHYEGAYRRVTDGSVMTDIHTIEGGWFWYIPLAHDLVSVGAVLDTDYVREMSRSDMQVKLERAIARAPKITEWLRSARQVMEVRTISNISYLNESFVGDGFVLVGDASCFVDPIFSAGVTLALRGGIFAAEEIDGALKEGNLSAERLKAYERRIRYPMDKIFRMIYNWYDVLKRKDANNLFARSRRAPLLRERLVVLLSGGYDRVDMEALLSGADG
jgi:halogenation protein CepH